MSSFSLRLVSSNSTILDPQGRAVERYHLGAEAEAVAASHHLSHLSSHLSMVKKKCPSRKLRDKRRMLDFLIVKKMKGFDVNLDYWSLLKDLKGTISLNDNLIDLKKQTEQRYFSLVATVECSSCNSDDDEEYVLDLIQNNMKINRARADLTTYQQTKFGKRSQFSYQYHVQIILDKRVTCPNRRLCKLLCQSFEYDRGKKFAFKIHTG